MKKTIKTFELVTIYDTISEARYSKMNDADKIKTWKLTRLLRPIAKKYKEDCDDVIERMKPSEDFGEKLKRAQEYERLTKAHQPTIDVMLTSEYNAFIQGELKSYNKVVRDAIKELKEKEVELDFEPVSEDSFGKLMASNDWTMHQATTIGDFICE